MGITAQGIFLYSYPYKNLLVHDNLDIEVVNFLTYYHYVYHLYDEALEV